MVLWPMQVLMRPLGCELYDDDLLGQGDPGAYRTLALQRVERGDGDATMLTIRYDDGQEALCCQP